jgi:hypothetical protein
MTFQQSQAQSKLTQVRLPTLHPDQIKAFLLKDKRTDRRARLRAIRCGRRWGKTDLAKTEICDAMVKGKSCGWFAPDYKISSEAYNDIVDIIDPVKRTSSKVEGVMRTVTNGRLDFWTLDNERAGRSRKYHLVVIDEAAFAAANMMDIWEKSILPTLLDYGGRALVPSNPNGVDVENFFWRICNEPEHGFVEYHAPTMNNPYVPARLPNETEADYLIRRAEVFAKLKADNHPLVYQQEYLAEFVDWSGQSFFELAKMLADRGDGTLAPLERPERVDVVFAVIDTAVKTGLEHDGSAVLYCGLSKTSKAKVTLLDWDIVQIEGALLETWLPTIFTNLEALAREHSARFGSLGAHIEDKTSGTILIQQARRRNWPAHEIDSKLTSLGKDARAISVSGYVYQGLVKFTRRAYDKVVVYKGTSKNHLVSQVVGFRVGDKDAAKRADDLLDCFCYAIAIALGDAKGF